MPAQQFQIGYFVRVRFDSGRMAVAPDARTVVPESPDRRAHSIMTYCIALVYRRTQQYTGLHCTQNRTGVVKIRLVMFNGFCGKSISYRAPLNTFHPRLANAPLHTSTHASDPQRSRPIIHQLDG
eukprot:649652-Rhodomonas_salina.2